MDTLFEVETLKPVVTHGCAGIYCRVCNPIDERKGRVRAESTSTSRKGAESVAYRAGSQKARLLREYVGAPDGLTDEEAAESAGLLRSCYWKRCGELRQDGLIERTGVERVGDAGVARDVCRLTAKGREISRLVVEQ